MLDPLVARANGVRDWESWYRLDDLAERMRATRRNNTGGAGLDDAGVIQLPPAALRADDAES